MFTHDQSLLVEKSSWVYRFLIPGSSPWAEGNLIPCPTEGDRIRVLFKHQKVVDNNADCRCEKKRLTFWGSLLITY
jgi:hypothetical protein